jgi:hypothetical protein
LGWTERDLFGLAEIPERPRPSYERLSRYDQTGLVWLLQDRRVVALTKNTAVIETANGALRYPRCNPTRSWRRLRSVPDLTSAALGEVQDD